MWYQDYLEREVESIIRELVSKLRGVVREQEVLDELYKEVVVVLKRGRGRQKRGSP